MMVSHTGRHARLGRVAAALMFALGVLWFTSSPSLAAYKVKIADDSSGARAVFDSGQLFLEVAPLPKEGLLAFAARHCGSSDAASQLAELNEIPGRRKRLVAGKRYLVPWSCLSPEPRRQVITALFPGSGASAEGWRHVVPVDQPFGDLWRVSHWLTGKGENYRAIRSRNQLADEDLRPGQTLVIPKDLLAAGFREPVEQAVRRAATNVTQTPAVVPALSGTSVDSAAQAGLSFGSDELGPFAAYRLAPGEALYTAVVVRFTGRLEARYVNQLASEIADRSKIADVTDIPVGYEVKIPFDLLMPEFLPIDHPKRQEWEANRSASGQFVNSVRALDLEGVTVVLDAGHGGRDPGTHHGNVRESDYVYDIMMRVRNLLEQRTAATVHSTTRIGSEHRIRDVDRLPASTSHSVLTTPPYAIADAKVSTNLRWYLANDWYARAMRQKRDPNKVVFLSIHADSLHPSLRGTMIYVPGLVGRTNRCHRGGAYDRLSEVKRKPCVELAWKDRVKSEGLSRDLAGHILTALRRRSLAIHKNKPVRDRIVRTRRNQYVPAVLRYNETPAKILIEVCNLANAEDRRLIVTRSYRQKVAESIVEGLLEYFGYTPLSDRAGTETAARP